MVKLFSKSKYLHQMFLRSNSKSTKYFVDGNPSSISEHEKQPYQVVSFTKFSLALIFWTIWKRSIFLSGKNQYFYLEKINILSGKDLYFNLEKINILHVICWHLPSTAFVWLSTKSIKKEKPIAQTSANLFEVFLCQK